MAGSDSQRSSTQAISPLIIEFCLGAARVCVCARKSVSVLWCVRRSVRVYVCVCAHVCVKVHAGTNRSFISSC